MIQRYVAIVCNPTSGKGKPLKVLPLLESYLSEQGYLYQTYIHNMPKHLHGFTDLVILGGDGTVNYVLNHFKKIEIPIGIIACGTGNDLAIAMHGKKTIAQQFEAVIHGQIHLTDAGVCNQKLFLNGVGIGFDGWVVKRLLAKKLFTGKAAYYSTVISLLAFYKESAVTIRVDEQNINTDLFMLSVANFKTYGGGFMVAPYADSTDNKLDVITISKLAPWKRLKYLPVIEKGKHLEQNLPFVAFKTGQKIEVKAAHKLQAHLDGEHMEAQEFEIELLPNYLKIRY